MVLRTLISAALITVLAVTPVYAVATPSDASDLDDIPLINDLFPDDNESDGDNDGLLGEILGHVKSLDDYFVSDDIASVSDADSLDPAEDDGSDEGETITFSNDALSDTQGDPDRYVNVLRFDITVDGNSYVCLIPPEYIDSLYIDAQDRLWNMSTQTIQGRIVDEYFNPYETEGILVYLTPCLGNNFSSVRNNGSPNYLREYYYTGSRYQYRDTYAEIVVDKYYYPFFVSDLWHFVLIFIVGGGVLICWLNRFRHY